LASTSTTHAAERAVFDSRAQSDQAEVIILRAAASHKTRNVFSTVVTGLLAQR
jgi:hypothetical protein